MDIYAMSSTRQESPKSINSNCYNEILKYKLGVEIY